jgi:hypothetical protein
VLAFDDTTAEECQWTFIAPQGLSGTLKARIFYIMETATSGTVKFDVSVEAVTDGDSRDLDSTDFFDTINSGSETVPGTVGYMDVMEITLSSKDNIAAGDLVRVKLESDTTGTASDDCYVLAVEIQDAV